MSDDVFGLFILWLTGTLWCMVIAIFEVLTDVDFGRAPNRTSARRFFTAPLWPLFLARVTAKGLVILWRAAWARP